MLLRQFVTVTPALGNATFKFPEVPVDRVWTATLSIPLAPSTALWEIAIGDQIFNNIVGPGPFGPFQLRTGDQMVVMGTGAGTDQLSANLLGANDASSDAPPYSGPSALPSPGAPTSVIISSPPLVATASVFRNGQGQLLAAPAAGTAYYLFSADFIAVSAGIGCFIRDAGSNNLALLVSGNGKDATDTVDHVNMYGLRVATAVSFASTDATQGSVVLRYAIGI
jgi:hypothetical protein